MQSTEVIKPIRVLLIEDDEDDFVMVRDLLSEVQGHRFTLEWTSDYEDALQRMQKMLHDVYLVDYRLGARTGLALLKEAMAAGCHSPVIMLTGLGDNEVDSEVLKVGASDYLVKGQINSSLLGRSIRYAIERAKTLENLRESEDRYRRLSDSTLEGIVFHQDGLILDANQAAASMFGYESKELIGFTCQQLVIQEEREKVTGYIRGNFAKAYESIGLRKDGSHFPLEVFGRAVSHMGQPCRVTALRDITERKRAEEAVRQSEEKFRSIFEQSRDPIYLTSRDGRFLEANPSTWELFGCSREELFNRNIKEFYFNPADRIEFQEEIETRGVLTDYEIRFRRKDDSEIDCLLSTTLRHDPHGAILGYQSIIRDITERKKMEENLLHTQKLNSLGLLAGGIAHDFNNLLMVIMGKAGIARRQLPKDAPALQCLDHISTASQRAADLCKQMLAYAGKGHFVMQILDLNHLIHETIQLLQISIPKSIDLKFHPDGSLPTIQGDPTQIRQVIMNLVVNASEAIGEKNGSINVSTGSFRANEGYFMDTALFKELESGDYVYMEVTDTGCGMDELTRARIFDPFYTTKFTGRGLGLAAVLGITRSHKGAIKIDSATNVGTTFRFMLPRMDGVPSHVLQDKPDESWQGSGTALIVDDEDNVRSMAAQMLNLLGYKVVVARDGLQGIETFKTHQDVISLVLIDLTMPKMNGQDVFRNIRALKPHLPTLLMSGYNEDATTAELSCQPGAGFLHKPFEFEDLRTKLRSVIQSAPTEVPTP